MQWYYVDHGQQAGPVEETELPTLVSAGKVKPETLVWHEGMANWEPFSAAAPPGLRATLAPPPAAPPITGNEAVCAQCGGLFQKDDMIAHGGLYVCAGCKPVFLQRLSEGVAPKSPPRPGTLSEDALLGRDYEVDVGGCLSRGWELFKANAGGMIGASVLVYLAFLVANAIPYLSLLLGIFLNGPLMGGLWIYFIKTAREQKPEIGDAFSGFGPRYWQLVLVQLIPMLLAIAAMFCLGILMAMTIPFLAAGARSGGAGSTAAPTAMLIILGFGLLVFFVVMIYFNLCWMFALPLAADKGLKFWPALELSRRMVNKHWWKTLWLMFVGGVLVFAGMLVCLVGALVTGPTVMAMWSAHYERVFGELAPQA